MQLSSYQQNIIDEVVKSQRNVVVNALAGSGKTFTAILAVEEYLQAHPTAKVCMCMFNKSIQLETSDKLDKKYIANPIARKSIKVRTSHSVGMAALRFGVERTYGKGVYDIEVDDKCHIAPVMANVEAYSYIIKNDSENKPTFVGNVKHIYDKCRVNLIQSNNTDGIVWVAQHYNIHPIADEISAVSIMLNNAYSIPTPIAYNTPKGTKTCIVIDYIDMLTFGATYPQYMEKFDLFIVDECQDFNMAMHKVMLNSIKKDGTFLAIGDPNQAINGFSGAMNDSFERFTKYQNVQVLPLSVNYRCATKVIELAQSLVPTIQAHDGATEGKVEYNCLFDNAQPNDYILSRKSAPLIKAALHLIAKGKYCTIVGGADITKGLKGLVISACGRSRAAQAYSTDIVTAKVDNYIKNIINDMVAKGEISPEDAQDGKLSVELYDKLECIKVLAEGCNNLTDLIAKLDTLSHESKGGNPIKLMTAHKSKGLEADNVYIIDYDSMPLTWKHQQEWEYKQETNLMYVAWTRAKQNLYICK